jgi:hypothetical protein
VSGAPVDLDPDVELEPPADPLEFNDRYDLRDL